MKSYEKMAEDVLSRIDEIETRKAGQRKAIAKIATPICCVCLIALAGFGFSRFGEKPPTLVDNSSTPSVFVGDSSSISVESHPDEAPNNIIVINELEEIPADQKMFFALFGKDFIEMTPEELNEYYGTNVFPTVPSDFTKQDGAYGIYKREGGTGELYWDGNKIQYSPERARRWIAVNVLKGRIPVDLMGVFNDPEEKSVINNVEVGIGRIAGENYDIYYAEFMYKNVGFKICADSVTEEEFIQIISSLIA